MYGQGEAGEALPQLASSQNKQGCCLLRCTGEVIGILWAISWKRSTPSGCSIGVSRRVWRVDVDKATLSAEYEGKVQYGTCTVRVASRSSGWLDCIEGWRKNLHRTSHADIDINMSSELQN